MTMNYPEDLRYLPEHTWARVEGDLGTVGITDRAQDELGEIVYVELPEVGTHIQARQKFGEIESVKTISELIAPVSGEVVAVNSKLKDSPTLVNEEPYGDGWMIQIRLNAPSELDDLLTAAEYATGV